MTPSQPTQHTREPDPATRPKLPLDMVEIVAQYLIAKDHHGTCANLNMVCRAVKDITDRILWRRVVFKWNNIAKRKKSEEKWKTVFESDGARFIQFLVIIPLHKPDVKHDHKTVNLSPLSLLLSNENRLKVCIVPDKNGRDIGIYLFENYEPCNSALWTIMQLVEATREITKGFHAGAYIHPCMELPSHAYSESGDFTTLLVQAFDSLPAAGEWDFPPFLCIGLVFPANSTLPLGYVKSMFADMVALLRESCRCYCDETSNAEGKMLPMMSIQIDLWGVSVQEAMMIGECLKVAYYLDKSLAASLCRMRTAEPVTPAQARAFLRIMEKAYFATKAAFRHVPPGGPSIFDESSRSTLHIVDPTQLMSTPFGPFEQVSGTMQYMPIGRGMIQGLRSVIVPPDQGDSRIEVLDFPE